MKSNYLFISIIICTLCICGTQNAVAQKVYKDENNKIILDCGPGSGFPQGAVETTTGQKFITPNSSTAADNNGENGTINVTVFYKLEIATTNFSSVAWVNAYNNCKSKGTAENGEIWRLPTQKELMYIFSTAINDLGGSISGDYWSGTESSNTDSRYVNFSTGYVYGKGKGYTMNARCVREIPMEPATTQSLTRKNKR